MTKKLNESGKKSAENKIVEEHKTKKEDHSGNINNSNINDIAKDKLHQPRPSAPENKIQKNEIEGALKDKSHQPRPSAVENRTHKID